MIPRLQRVYDLLDVHPQWSAPRERALRTWLRDRPDRPIGGAVRELYVADLDRWQPDGERRHLLPLAAELEHRTPVTWFPLVEALDARRVSGRLHLGTDDHALVTVPFADDPDPEVLLYLLDGPFWAGRLSAYVATTLLERGLVGLPWQGWLRTPPVPLVEPAVDWLLDHGAEARPHGSTRCVVLRLDSAVTRVSIDDSRGEAVWFFGGLDAEALRRAVSPLARRGLAPRGLISDADVVGQHDPARARLVADVLAELA